MLCQRCGINPAEITIKENINGQIRETHLCSECAAEINLFDENEIGDEESPSEASFDNEESFFDSFFPRNSDLFRNLPFGFRFRFPQEKINILDYFSQRAKKVIANSIEKAKEVGAKYVDTEHLLLSLLEEEVALKIFDNLKIKVQDLASYIRKNMLIRPGVKKDFTPSLSPRAKKVLELAFQEARNLGHNYVGSEHILLGLIKEDEGMAAQTLKKYDLDIDKVRKTVVKTIGLGKRRTERSNTPILDQFSVDLTAQAQEGKLDPVIGRADEIARVIQILSRRTKNNPVLIGEPGVGKTAIVEGLAQRIVSGNIPETLRNKRVVAINLGGLVSGTKYRGEFEKRLKQIIDEIRQAQKEIILFIDELHTLVGAGAAEGAIDASNMLKPTLAKGELQAIGATTLDEYRKYIEKDAALERRFQPILVEEPNVNVCCEILRGLRDRYESHHKVRILDEAIVAAVSLSDRFINDRYLPDKAIDLIDEAAAKVRLASLVTPEKLKELEKEIKHLKKEKEAAERSKNRKQFLLFNKQFKEKNKEKKRLERKWQKNKSQGLAEVTAKDIKEVLSKWTKIPITELAEEESEKLLKLEDKLHQRIIGQEEAVKAVANAIRRGRAGLKNPARPVGSFLFLGPTGVGKTELSKALAWTLFGDESALIRLDMSEYMERHTVSRLIGSPPGYVGYEEGGQLTEKVRQKPYSVILLDEIEKAHPDVFNILLQILDDGRLTDAKGRTIDFKNTVIIATSNIGSDLIAQRTESNFGFETSKSKTKKTQVFQELKNQLMDELKKTFRPEFLNRIDEIIFFHSLSPSQIKQIVDLMLDEVIKLLAGQGIKLEIDSKVKDVLAKKGYDPTFGARPLRRVIQKKLENPLSTLLLAGKFKSKDTIKVRIGKYKEFVFEKIKEKTKKKKTAHVA